MKVLAVFRKGVLEQLREPWLLLMLLVMTPFFILIYALVFGGSAWSYRIAYLDEDVGASLADGSSLHAGAELAAALGAEKDATGMSTLEVLPVRSSAEAEAMLTGGRAHALIAIPPGFSAAIAASREHRPVAAAELVYEGDLQSQSYMVAAVLAITAASDYVEEAADHRSPITFVEHPLGGSGARSQLDMALPGLFVFGIILLLFPLAMALARESESGTLRRVMLTRISSFDLLAGLSLVQLLIGVAVVGSSYATALAVGFHSQGPLWLGLAICVVASFASIGVGLLVACFSRSVTEAFILGNFPMIPLMFFSGAMIPLPQYPIATIGSVTIGLWDWLPTTHAVSAMNKVMGIGVGIGDVTYELVSLVVLSGVYFVAGVWLFKKRRMVAD